MDFERLIREAKAIEEHQRRETKRPEFDKWFTDLLYKTESCFERDVLRATKNELFESWCNIPEEGVEWAE